MNSFYIFDVCFLCVFIAAIVLLIVKNKKRVKRDGIMFMFRTQIGVKWMDNFAKKHHKLLSVLRYVIIILGYILMIAMVTLLIQSLWVYVVNPNITDIVAAPPIAPLIPYFPELFGMESYFPPFYFTYFIIAIVIVGICHEFSHGIFMKYSKTKIKSTGAMFLGPVIGFFVEQDDKDFRKKGRLDQMAAIGAGVFANILVFLIFLLLISGYTALFFNPSGYSFDDYTYSVLNSSEIQILSSYGNYTIVNSNGNNYYILSSKLELFDESELFYAYDETPAFLNNIEGKIIGIDDFGVEDQKTLALMLSNYNPGESAIVTTKLNGEIHEYNVTFAANPTNESKAYLGIVSRESTKTGISKILSSIMLTLDEDEYDCVFNKDVGFFIYYLFWWIMIINLLVGLFNMLPWGILDGGRFMELTVGRFTNEKNAAKITKVIGMCVWGILILMMCFWLYGIIT